MVLDLIKTKIQYPKLLLLLMSILGAYFLFQADIFLEMAEALNSHGYMAIFIAGFFFAYGFTAPLSVGVFVTLAPQVNILLAAALAGLGALIADLLIFRYIRTSFQGEFDRLKLIHIFQILRERFNQNISIKMKKYLLWSLAGILVASPLPDEFGVSLIGGFTNLNNKVFGCISYLLNLTGVLIILSLAKFGIGP